MRLKEITLQNFKPFYGEIQIPFDEEPGVTLFGAKNDRGKTAFLEAVRFCLYDFTSDDEGSREEKRNYCINRKAVTEEAGVTSVAISFEHNGGDYTIKRVLEYDYEENRSARTAENHYVTVIVDGQDDHYIDTREGDAITDYREFRESILPEDASHFFIFDGEQIDDYARRFGKRDADVREAIELVLGIEELRKAEDDLEEHGIREYRKKFQEAQSDAEEYEDKKQELDSEREELESLEDDLDGKESELVDKEEEKSDVEERLADAGEVQDQYEQLIKSRSELWGPENVENAEEYLTEDEIEDLSPGLEHELIETRSKRQNIYQRFGPIAGRVAAEKLETTSPLETPGGVPQVLQLTLDEWPDDCYICEQDLDGASRQEMMERLDNMTNEATKVAYYLDQLAAGLREVTQEDEYDTGNQKSQFNTLSEKIDGLNQKRTKLETRIESLEETIENAEFGEDEVDEIRDQFNDLIRQIERLEVEIEVLEEEISDQEEVVNELQQELDGMPGASTEEERFSKLIEVSEQAHEAFQAVKDQYVELRRESVQEKASDLFTQMTNKPEVYRGLSIHTDYQLRIRTTEGTFTIPDQDPSRGARQIIAYSFIAGLAQFSSRDAPILIDTPIARLDRGHKNNLLANLPGFVDQVIVFYQPDELREDDIDVLREGDHIVDHHNIIKDPDDPKVSSIVDHDPQRFLEEEVTADD